MKRIGLALAVLGLIVGGVTFASATHWPDECIQQSENSWHGTGGNDNINLPNTTDTGWCVDGLTGDDDIESEDANGDTIHGRPGSDTLRGGPGGDYVSGGDNIDNLLGEGGNDHIYDGKGADIINGGSGTDTWHPCDDGSAEAEVTSIENTLSTSSANCDGPF